ncbi:MAG: hypothetical protein ACKVT1_04690 [Dehalococcoidia bacterium]
MNPRFGPAAAKRLLLAGAALAALSLGVTTAAGHEDDDRGTTTTRPISWTIPAGQCSLFPAHAFVSGEGTFTGYYEEKTHRDGTITRIYRDHAEGIATDGHGNKYRFVYDFRARIRNSVGNPNLFVGTATDLFQLKGRGPLRSTSGFVADYTEGLDGLTEFTIFPRSTVGDSIAFPAINSVESHCDPI